MTHESFIAYCVGMPFAEPDFPFDDNVLTYKVKGKIFALITTNPPGRYALKCNPDYAIELREEWMEIEPAFHLNKKYWIQLDMSGALPDDLVRRLVNHSYEEVVRKLPKKIQAELRAE